LAQPLNEAGMDVMKKTTSTEGPITIKIERDLKKHMRAISVRLNENPDLARLVLINPILVLEDLGVELSNEVKKHIMDSLRFPKALVKRRDELACELKTDLAALKVHHPLPLTDKQRSDLVFNTLKINPKDKHEVLSVEKLRAYKDEHPVLTKLAEFERYSKGALIFYPRNVYEKYKTGEKKLHWVNAIQFKT
jgi:hypothetical protein